MFKRLSVGFLRWLHRHARKPTEPIGAIGKLDVKAGEPQQACTAVLGLPFRIAAKRGDPVELVSCRDARTQIATRLATGRRIAPRLAQDAAASHDAATALHPLTRALLLHLRDAALELGQECLLLRELVREPERELQRLGHRSIVAKEVTWTRRLDRSAREQRLHELGAGPVVHLLDQA